MDSMRSRCLFIFASLACAVGNASQVRVTIDDAKGKGIAEVVVVAIAANPQPIKADVSAVMDQIDKRFVPEVLVVRVGTSVNFPNSDAVAHQVYSFSPAKRFALPLYRGRAHPPLVFDQPGVVVLGCNIHDQMVGYIYVTPSPYFGKSNAQGSIEFTTLPPGNYRVTVWHPRFDEEVADQDLKVTDHDPAQLKFALKNALRPMSRPTKDRTRVY